MHPLTKQLIRMIKIPLFRFPKLQAFFLQVTTLLFIYELREMQYSGSRKLQCAQNSITIVKYINYYFLFLHTFMIPFGPHKLLELNTSTIQGEFRESNNFTKKNQSQETKILSESAMDEFHKLMVTFILYNVPEKISYIVFENRAYNFKNAL